MEQLPTPRASRNADPTSPRAIGPLRWGRWAAMLLVAPLLIALPIPAATSAAPVVALAPAASPGANGSWAWGVAANASFALAESGELNSSAIPGANLTGTTVNGSVALAATESYANVGMVSVTTTNATAASIALQSVVARVASIQGSVSARLPNAGVYAPGQVVPTSPENGSIALTEEVLSADVVFLNITVGANGSIGLVDEHLEVLRAFNISLAATNFPNVTVTPNGSLDVKYVSAQLQASGIFVANLTATFGPALVIYGGSGPSGTSWTTTSNVTFTGEAAQSVRFTAHVPGGTSATWTASAAASLSGGGPVTFACSSTPATLPYGGNGRAVNCTAQGNATVATDGLEVVPTAAVDGAAPAGASPAGAGAPASPTVTVPARPVYQPGARAPSTVTATPWSGSTMTAQALTPSQARSQMAGLRSPASPSSAPEGDAGAVLVVGGISAVAVAGVVALRRRRRV